MDNLLIKDVIYKYKNGDREVLKSVNAFFEPGYMYSVVGPSGSGKTTLLSIMAGLDLPTSGEVYIGGENVKLLNLNEYRSKRISVIFQAFQLFPLLTTVENVSYPLEFMGTNRKNATERAKILLNSVGIDENKHKRYPANLSGGEQQRVAIARALSTGAKIILADEPTGNLDLENGRAVISILQKLAHEEKYCVIVVTHNQEIADISDTVYKMSDGILTEVAN
ncbi:MAG: ABC transporter ATP-binding protein [Firmicutes bacterium]|nr:ABC transporter ATP-binding protein [Bacillota bacterium]